MFGAHEKFARQVLSRHAEKVKDPEPVLEGPDIKFRIRIRSKMFRIQNTA
jgi:hypothetical protein